MDDVVPMELSAVVERFDHFAIAVADIADALPLVGLLGGVFRNGGDNYPGQFRWIQFFLPQAGKVEVLAPLDGAPDDHFLVKFLASRGPGLHHITVKVADIDAAVEAAEAAGFRVTGYDTTTYTRWKEAFLHPKTASGTLIQLAEFPDRSPPSHITVADVLSGIPEDD